jgi:hypothetical protein
MTARTDQHRWHVTQYDLMDADDRILGTVNRDATGEYYACAWQDNGDDIREIGWYRTLEEAQDALQLEVWGIQPEPENAGWGGWFAEHGNDALAPGRGVVNGLLVSAVIWLVVIALAAFLSRWL